MKLERAPRKEHKQQRLTDDSGVGVWRSASVPMRDESSFKVLRERVWVYIPDKHAVSYFRYIVDLSYIIHLWLFYRVTPVWNTRREFGAYARRGVRRLAKNMEQTSSSLLSSKWLAGARIVYEAVRARRSSVGKETRSFADWVGIQQYTSDVDIGMSGLVIDY